MTEEKRKPIVSEQFRAIGALQDAFAYAQHAEEIAASFGLKAERARVAMLRKQIMTAIDHAGILHQALKRD